VRIKLHNLCRERKAGRGAPGATRPTCGQSGSVLIIVLWIALGLVTLTLYFANSSSFELQASDNRTAGLATEEAIDGRSELRRRNYRSRNGGSRRGAGAGHLDAFRPNCRQ